MSNASVSVALAAHETGLTEAEAEESLAKHGKNTIEAKKKNPVWKFVRWFLSPIPLMLAAAAGLSWATGKEADGALIFFLLIANFGIQRWHEHKADQAVAKLEKNLASHARVKRDGAWQMIATERLVPGDLIALRAGSAVPADAKVLTATNLSLNESTLTGESLPKEKTCGDTVYSASYVATGAATARVTKTGASTFFGAALKTLEFAHKRSVLEEDILSISKVLAVLALIAIGILTTVLLLHGADLAELSTLDISLLIAGIPVALPTVMSLIITAGVLNVAKQGAVVRRLSSLEDLANVNLLLSDKTGTLTQNKVRVASVAVFGKWSEQDALAFAAAATDPTDNNALESAVREAAKERQAPVYTPLSMTPADSERKRSTAAVNRAGDQWLVSLGAPFTIASLTSFGRGGKRAYDKAVAEASDRGDRALALSVRKTDSMAEEHLEPVALIFLADALRSDARETVQKMRAAGIDVKMLTGDGLPIAQEVARQLNLEGSIYDRGVFDDTAELMKIMPEAAGFAQVLPEDKYTAVETAKRMMRVAVTGDGANDLPSVSDADVGIAVANAVDALRDSADIVLTTNGLSVISTAIREARKVFIRLYHYSLYRLSESAALILTILIIGWWIGTYPLTPIQVLLLAFLNDVPIITIAFDRVRVPNAPAAIDRRRRTIFALLYGIVTVASSVALLWLVYYGLHLSWPLIQSLFFLQLVVSGHMLIFIAHTRATWYRWLPSWQVVVAIAITQILATLAAYAGLFTAAMPVWLIGFVWVWSFLWMQLTALSKSITEIFVGKDAEPVAAA